MLVLDLTSVDADVVPSAGLTVFSEGKPVWEDTLFFDGGSDVYMAAVPREDMHLRVWAGGGRNVSLGGLHIPVGHDCPRVYMHDSDVRAVGEQIRETITMKKNHCVVTVMTEQGRDFCHDMKVTGNVSGYTSDGQPEQGVFEYDLDPERYDEGWKVVLPRQLDDSLLLQIDDGKGTVKTFSLGQYIVASGYDWDSIDLADVTVSLDYALTELKISIEGWESEYTFDVVL